MIRDAAFLRLLAAEVLLYAIALALLHWQNWGPKDVIWSLWATSLLTGYLTLIVGSIGSAVNVAVAARQKPDFSWQQALPLLADGIVIMAVMIAFFSVHFGLFHLVHAVFLNEFFPLIQWPDPEPHMVEQALAYLQTCLQEYSLFLLICLLSHLPALLQGMRGTPGGMLIRPYATVIKLHLMILGIGFATAAGLDATALIVFLGVYFLPLGRMLQLLRGTPDMETKR